MVNVTFTDEEPQREEARREAVDKALALCLELAPNGSIQAGFVGVKANLERHGVSRDAVVKGLISNLMDGLQYGNWPIITDSKTD